MTPERTAYLRQIATNTMAHGKTWTGPLGEVLMQAADAIRELATEADELAALRIEHAAWGAIIDVTRKDRDALRARVAELERLQVSIHKAGDGARKAERDRCAAIVSGWHIRKGGYTELAHTLRQDDEGAAGVKRA